MVKRVTELLYFEKWPSSRQASSRAMPRQTTNIVRMPCIPHVPCTLYLYIHFTFYTYVQLLSFSSKARLVICVCLRNLCVQSHVKCECLPVQYDLDRMVTLTGWWSRDRPRLGLPSSCICDPWLRTRAWPGHSPGQLETLGVL